MKYVLTRLSPAQADILKKELERYYSTQLAGSLKEVFAPWYTERTEAGDYDYPQIYLVQRRIDQYLPKDFYSQDRVQQCFEGWFQENIPFPMPKNNQEGKPIMAVGGTMPEYLYEKVWPHLVGEGPRRRALLKLINVYLMNPVVFDRSYATGHIDEARSLAQTFGLGVKMLVEQQAGFTDGLTDLFHNRSMRNLGLRYLVAMLNQDIPPLVGSANHLESSQKINDLFQFGKAIPYRQELLILSINSVVEQSKEGDLPEALEQMVTRLEAVFKGYAVREEVLSLLEKSSPITLDQRSRRKNVQHLDRINFFG